ncbi:MAG: ABC transporter ATP-binding protein/permease [Flavobacteriaceae bacterium]|nr:ABC transporter ATP-binding protein/permease [Flavobacteriaceae bacterium]
MKTKWQLIYSFITSNPLLVIAAFLSGLCYNILTLLIPISLGRFYEFNFGFSSQRLKLLEALPFINTESFTIFLLFFLVLILIRFIFEYSNKYVIAIIGERFAKDLREQLFEHQLQISTSIYDQKGIGKYLLRYSGDLKSIQNYVTRGLFRFSQDIFLITFLLITIAYIDIYLGSIAAITIGFSIVILFFINNVLYSISVNRRNQRSNMLTFVNTRLRAIQSIKAFNKYTSEEKRYVKRSEKLYTTGKKFQLTISLIQAIIPALTYLMLALLMWYVYYLKTNKGDVFNETALLILILLIISFLPILRRTLRVSIIWKLGNISFQKLLQIFSLEAENNLPFERINLSAKEINFNEVSFRYSALGNVVFNKLNITFIPKKITIIIGESGSGKNTLINLLLKIYQPTTGIINYGRHNHKELSEKTIRKNISVISDTFPLYGKTVYEAVVYSRKKETALKATKLLKELQQFEDEKNWLVLYDTIGDLGNTLTNGQKRILMYCRALLTNKPWLIIDQPFKDLNIKTANHIKNILKTFKDNKTIIIIDIKIPEDLKGDYIYTIKNNTLSKL